MDSLRMAVPRGALVAGRRLSRDICRCNSLVVRKNLDKDFNIMAEFLIRVLKWLATLVVAYFLLFLHRNEIACPSALIIRLRGVQG